MSQELTNQDFVTKELAKYNLNDVTLAELEKKYMPLKVKAFDDRMGYDICKIAHREVTSIRIGIEKTRTGLKASSLDFGRKVDAEAKRLTEKIKEIENHLITQRKIVEDEKARIEKEKVDAIRVEEERKKREEEERIEALRLKNARKERELEEKEERIRIEQEKKEREFKAERAKIQEEDDAAKKKIREAQEKIEADKQAIEEEKARIEAEKQEAIEKERQNKIDKLYQKRRDEALPYKQFWSTDAYVFGVMSEANFQNVMSDLKGKKKAYEAELEAKRAQAEINRIADEKAEAARVEALKPDIEKIYHFATDLKNIQIPIVNSDSAKILLTEAKKQLSSIADYLFGEKL